MRIDNDFIFKWAIKSHWMCFYFGIRVVAIDDVDGVGNGLALTKRLNYSMGFDWAFCRCYMLTSHHINLESGKCVRVFHNDIHFVTLHSSPCPHSLFISLSIQAKSNWVFKRKSQLEEELQIRSINSECNAIKNAT